MSNLVRRVLVLAFAGWAGVVSAVPITGADIVTVDGTDWAQVDLFTNLSWNAINAYCPGGVCGTGRLNGHDMEGWVWASQDDLNALFNSYLIAANVPAHLLLSPTRHSYSGNGEVEWVDDFLSDGWRITFSQPAPTRGAIHEGVDGRLSSMRDPMYGHRASFQTYSDDRSHFFATNFMAPVDNSWSGTGAWFYRNADHGPMIPVPTTFGLFGLGLAGLGWMRRK